jgi:hypothetical protein
MTKGPVAASIGIALSLAACGGGGGGGGNGAPPSDPNAPPEVKKVIACLSRAQLPARADKAGARLLNAPKATSAIVVQAKGNTANVLFFPREADAEAAKNKVPNSDLVNKEKKIVIVYSKDPNKEQRNGIEECLPQDTKKKS